MKKQQYQPRKKRCTPSALSCSKIQHKLHSIVLRTIFINLYVLYLVHASVLNHCIGLNDGKVFTLGIPCSPGVQKNLPRTECYLQFD